MNQGGALSEERRLFIRLGTNTDWTALSENVLEALPVDDMACVLFPPLDANQIEVATKIAAKIQASDRAVLASDDMKLVRLLAADGVHLSDHTRTADVRKRIGPNMVLGAHCPLERHAAMQAGEAGADYIAFSITRGTEQEARDLLSWWTEIMVLPVVAFIDEDSAEMLALGELADFFSPPC